MSSGVRIHFQNAAKHWIEEVDLVEVMIEELPGGEVVLGEGAVDIGDGGFVDGEEGGVGCREEEEGCEEEDEHFRRVARWPETAAAYRDWETVGICKGKALDS